MNTNTSLLIVLRSQRDKLCRAMEDVEELLPEESKREAKSVYVGNYPIPGLDFAHWEMQDNAGDYECTKPLRDIIESIDHDIRALETAIGIE